MKAIRRWYYRLFHKKRCFKCTLEQRIEQKIERGYDPINYWHHSYLGAGWWLISKEEYDREKQRIKFKRRSR